MARTDVIGRSADRLAHATFGHPTRVAVDGITAAGKTTLANELATALTERGRTATVTNPTAVRSSLATTTVRRVQ
jgi:adenylylsulfate kinase-like enzyme